nr:TetR/AcrR family transcriptional regulator [Vibrio parahaemolyticus]
MIYAHIYRKKRIRIIEVATDLFIEQGYKDTSLDQIVAICGGSKQTLYRYFSNKEGLFVEVLAYNTKTSLESVFQLADKQEEPLQKTLHDFAKKYLKGICSNPILSLYRIVSADFNKHDSVPNQFWQTGPQRIHQYLIDFFKCETISAQLNIKDADLACEQLLALIKLDYHNMALMGFDFPTDEELDLHTQKAVAAFLALYQR